MSQAGTVSVITGYGMDDYSSIPARGLDVSLCLHVFTPVLLSTQLSRDVGAAGQVHRPQRERRYLQ
jgi:hypothetical protein